MNLARKQQDSVAPIRSARHVVSSLLAASLVLGTFLWARPSAAQTVEAPATQPPAGSAAAQEPTDPNPGAFTLSGGVDFLNRYMFRGIRQNSFGFFSVAGVVTVPLGPTSRFGAWNVHGGAEFQKLGDTTKFFNGGDGSQVIGSIGIGFSY